MDFTERKTSNRSLGLKERDSERIEEPFEVENVRETKPNRKLASETVHKSSCSHMKRVHDRMERLLAKHVWHIEGGMRLA